MELIARLAYFGYLDGLSVFLLLLCWAGIGWKIENPSLNNPSVSSLMANYRREWMIQYITRQPRIFDATILSSLRRGTTFFASGTVALTEAALSWNCSEGLRTG